MKPKIYVSTGTVMGRKTNFDYSVIETLLPRVCGEAGIDGIEYIIMPPTYDRLDDIRHTIERSHLVCGTLHADKDIGVLLSRGGKENADEALRRWEINCREAERLDCHRAVLHLWGDAMSDTNFGYNASYMRRIIDIGQNYDVRVMTENIPCVQCDPLTHWRELEDYDCDFIFDVRFGQFHGQIADIIDSAYMKCGRITHMHISDFGGEYKEFSKIRPVLHPYEGKIDYPALLSGLRRVRYKGTYTLESPVVSDSGEVDGDKLIKTLSWLRREADIIAGGDLSGQDA